MRVGDEAAHAHAGVITGDLLSHPWVLRSRRALAGLGVAAAIALVAGFISTRYGGPVLLYALFFGMAFNFLSVRERIRPGIDVAARQVLRVGVALLGARITLEQIMSLGVLPIALVLAGVAATIACGVLLAHVLERSREEGVLTGGAVAICGASAALAISAVLPRTPAMQRMTLFTVVGVTALSTLAMILYPALVGLLGLQGTRAGIFLGATIHDVAQVVAAGYIISPQAGDTATFVKLLRVLLLVPVVALLAWRYHARARDNKAWRPPLLPFFLIAFMVLVVLNSLGILPAVLLAWLPDVSRACLVVAIAALGVKTSFQELASLGWRPVALMLAETLILAVLVLAVLLLAA